MLHAFFFFFFCYIFNFQKYAFLFVSDMRILVI
uniref:Uncharacterized protein n=1 Tax=Anguilla anguilla TaxID=7936 RepID=A0A0E9Q655_ANGAN